MSQPNRTKSALLGFLTWGSMSGYDLRRVIEGSIANFWSESYGRIYPMLAQLVQHGLATRTETESSGGRPRHIYQITDEGREAFDAWLEEPVAMRPPRNELMLKLFFGARSEPATAARMVETYREQLADKLGHLAGIRETVEGAKQAPPDREFWLMTLRLGELETSAHLSWCDEVLPRLCADTTR